MARRKRISKPRLFFVLFMFVLVVYLLFKIVTGVGGYIDKKLHPGPVPVTKTAEQIEAEENRKINIIIDPAKGGKEKGLVGFRGSQYEKDLNLDIAKLIEANLSRHDDVKVMLTREYDDYIKAEDRAKFAKKHEGDLLVSIRINAQSGSNEANGMDVYYSNPNVASISNEDPDDTVSKVDGESNKDVLDSDNRVSSTKNTSAESDSDKSQEKRRKIPRRSELSKELAESIQATSLSFVSFSDRGTREASYDILNYTQMPSVIVHSGFITNKGDVELLETPSTRTDLANGISEGILKFIDKNRESIIKDRINYR